MNRLYLTLIPILSSFLFLPTACAFCTHPTSSQRNSVVLANQLSEKQLLAVSPPESTKPRQVSNSPTPTGLVNKIDRIAQQITVKIDARNPNNGNGSGVIIAHQENTYYVLTAFHVVENQDEYKIVTPDKQQYLVQEKNIIKEKGLDVAILQFSSNKTYQVATLAKQNLSDVKISWVFLSGFPSSEKGKRKFTPGYRYGTEAGAFFIKDAFSSSLSNGYELVYTNLSLPGMSGGPLLDVKGRVIGIGGRQEGEQVSNNLDIYLGYALGVPISTGLRLASKAGIKAEWMRAETTSAPNFIDLPKADIASILDYLTSSVEKPPADDNSYKWVNYGIQNWQAFRIDEAVNALNKAIKLKPDFYQAYYVLGLVLQGQEKYQEAIAAYEQATKIRPDYYKAWREQSEALAKLKKYPEAIAAIDQAINNNPKDFTLYVNKGQILFKSDRFPDAEAAYTEAIKIKENSIAYYNRGAARLELKNYQGAEADFNKTIELNPDDYQAYRQRGDLRRELKKYQEAEADYNQAIALNPGYAKAYNNRGSLRYKLENYQGAEADLTKIIELNPKDDRAYYHRGGVRKKLKNYQGAIADYNQAIKLNPKDAEFYTQRGSLRSELKDAQGAEADYNQAIALQPNNATTYLVRGLVREQLNNYQGAETDFNKFVEIQPNHATAYFLLGTIHTHQVDRKNYQQRAEAYFTRAIALKPEFAEAYNSRGLVRQELKNYSGAKADFNKAAQLFVEQRNMDMYQKVQQTLRMLP